MQKSTTYFDNGFRFDTYKFVFMYEGHYIIKILVKKEGTPFKTVQFVKTSGRMIKPTENYQNIIPKKYDNKRNIR